MFSPASSTITDVFGVLSILIGLSSFNVMFNLTCYAASFSSHSQNRKPCSVGKGPGICSSRADILLLKKGSIYSSSSSYIFQIAAPIHIAVLDRRAFRPLEEMRSCSLPAIPCILPIFWDLGHFPSIPALDVQRI